MLQRGERRLGQECQDLDDVLIRKRPLASPVDPVGALDAVRDRYERDPAFAEYTGVAGSGLADRERTLVLALLPTGARLLIVGCAAGREAFGFHALGYRVAGVDLSRRLIAWARAYARDGGLDIAFHVGNILEPRESWGAFDALFFADSVYNYIPTKALRLQCLRRVQRLLDSRGSRLLFLAISWVVPPPRTRAGRAVDRFRGWAAGFRRPANGLERGDALLRDRLPGRGESPPVVFHFFRDPRDVRSELATSGLALIREQDGMWVLQP